MMSFLDPLIHALHAWLVLPTLGFLRFVFPDLFDDVRPRGDELDFSTSPLVMETPGLFPQAHRLNDVASDGDDSGPLSIATSGDRHDPSRAAHESPELRHTANAAAASGSGRVYVMRHGEREDMIDAKWASTAERQWDPPLSQYGMQQANFRGREFATKNAQIDMVITSPFTRCIQTASGFMQAFGLPADRLMVDARVCEWMSSRNLNFAHIPASRREALLSGEGKRWFWGASALQGIRKAVTAAWSGQAAAQVQVGSLHFPRVNETQEEARDRFQKAIEALSSEHKGGLLVVTHGDALGAIVEHAVWNSVVYQVDTTGYVTMERRLDGDLGVLEAEGVAWMAD